MKLVFHIGTHKTATTSIQKFFTANNGIARSNGIYYPCASPPPTRSEYAHHELPRIIRSYSDGNTYKLSAKELAMKYLRDYDGQDYVVISSEGLSNLRGDVCSSQLRYFADQINPDEVEVVCYFRELIDYANSAIRQRIQATDCVPKSFYTFMASYDRAIYSIADLWVRVGELSFSLFDNDCFRGGDIVSDFLFKVGGIELVRNLSKYQDRNRENASIGGLLAIAKVAWNAMGERVSYRECLALAELGPNFQLPLWIPTSISSELRVTSIRNRSLRQMIGPPKEKPFSQFKLAETKDELIEHTRNLLHTNEFSKFPQPDDECISRAIDSLCFYGKPI